MAADSWAINVDSLMYDEKEVFLTPGKKLAIIDSASVNIQLP
jgi:hypothetical protein